MHAARPISVHYPALSQRLVIFVPLLIWAAGFLVFILLGTPLHPPYPGQEWGGVLVNVLAWAWFLFLVRRDRQHRVELLPDGITCTQKGERVALRWEEIASYEISLTANEPAGGELAHDLWVKLMDNGRRRFSRGPSLLHLRLHGSDGRTVSMDSKLGGCFRLFNELLHLLDPVLTARCIDRLRAGETVAFGPRVSLSLTQLRVEGRERELDTDAIFNACAIDGRVRVRYWQRWISLGEVPSAYTLCAVLRSLNAPRGG